MPLGVEVKMELPRVRPHPDRIDLGLALVTNPDIQDILGKNVTLQEELVVLLQGAQGLIQGAGNGSQCGLLLRR